MRLLLRLFLSILALVTWVGATPTPPTLQQAPVPYHKQAYHLDSGVHEGAATETVVAFQETVRVPGAPWLQLHFADYNLGAHSYLALTSLEDEGHQRLDATSLPQWHHASAVFNGDTVRVELYVAPGEAGVFFRMEEILVGEWVSQAVSAGDDISIESLCGNDDRVASTDPRVGRLFFGGCTAYLVSNGAFLTAGHCADFDPDGAGPLLPDGTLDLGGVVEFNVPASQANGTPVAANPNDQYPIDTNNVTWNYDGEGQGLGKDWAVFSCFPNANTNLLPHHAQGDFFRMTREAPSGGNTIRITGYGVDDDPPGSTGGHNAQSETEQTDTGPYLRENSSGADLWHEYVVDTMEANSGSPIIWVSNDFSIGIHTNAGCNPPNDGNNGTSFEHDPLEDALQDFPGPNVVYVDRVSVAPTEDGTVFQPYDTLSEAVSAVSPGAIVSIVEGSYDETLTINKRLTLEAPVGGVIVGD